MTRALSLEAVERLHATSDDWTMQPAEWSPSAIVTTLKRVGLLRVKRERPAAMSPFRYYLKRTAEGRAVLGLPSIEEAGQ